MMLIVNEMMHQFYALNCLQYVTVIMQRKPRIGKSGAVGVSTQVPWTLHDFIYLLCHLYVTRVFFHLNS